MTEAALTTDFTGRGWAYPLGVRHNGAIALVDGVANLEKAMTVVLLTYLGERPMRPLFGSTLRDFLFDGASPDNLRAIADEVTRAIGACEPRVRVDQVQVSPAGSGLGRFLVDIGYTVLATNHERNLVVPFYAIPGEEE